MTSRKYNQRILVMGIIAAVLAACAGERPENLGAKDDLLSLCPSSPNCVSSQSRDERHAIAPLLFSDDPAAAFARLKQLLQRRKDTSIVAQSAGYLRVEFHTTLFVDDGEFLLDRERKIIAVRSASRVGYSDLGKNRSRIEEIRRAFESAGAKK